MTDKTQEALKALGEVSSAVQLGCMSDIGLNDKNSRYYYDKCETIRAALQKPEPVDVERLKDYLKYMADTARENGYPETVEAVQSVQDHLAEQGHLSQPPVEVDLGVKLEEVEGALGWALKRLSGCDAFGCEPSLDLPPHVQPIIKTEEYKKGVEALATIKAIRIKGESE